jgi:hypothetical protein
LAPYIAKPRQPNGCRGSHSGAAPIFWTRDALHEELAAKRAANSSLLRASRAFVCTHSSRRVATGTGKILENGEVLPTHFLTLLRSGLDSALTDR